MGMPLILTPVERELIDHAGRGKKLNLSRRRNSASKSIRATVIVELATNSGEPWRRWQVHAKGIRLKGAVITKGPLYFPAETVTRPIELSDCQIQETVVLPYAKSA